ncbi:phospholipid/cholesterol/gamma-HCH transport system substrate-binding protein [Amycolatopsis marina]|uniref:Phospholipid/cholesterol/gamma-HCH transport system substrate-binding protein n=1 Tax=Amycolatopsis marina TaxID=490629 RepID=A0A1I0ZT42_9PSEU|nr:MlaD family protein [Amycolatopsis marina]SFB28949.1 phospholipid/cholesterol/gamma-HCH transport system substrate-binding protein [Amycolatopsis marina]
MRSRLGLGQLALFAAIGLVCSYFVAADVLGPQAFRSPITVTVRMPDTGGLSVASQVTYRGVGVGQVADLGIAPGGGVEATLEINPGERIPSAAEAVITMDSPLAILHVDLRPSNDAPPYLEDGSVIPGENTRRPLPLETLLEDFLAVADSLPAADLAVLGEALATGLNGTAPELERILDNTEVLLRFAKERQPQIERVTGNGMALLGEGGARLREFTEAMRGLTSGLRAQEPAFTELLHAAPDPARRVAGMMADNQPALTTLLGNLVTTTQLVSVRAPAVEQTLISLPDTLTKLGGIVEGDAANFYLVGTQGPVCYNDTPRRPPQDIAAREPVLTWHCPPGPDLGQRGARNAPRPDTPVRPSRAHDPETGRPLPFDVGTGGGQHSVLGPRSWSSILLQGVQ